MAKVNLGRVVGNDGRGIEKIEKTATNGLIDTYTITYSDGTKSTYTVTNGKDGINGTGVSETSVVSPFNGLTASFYGDSLTEQNVHYTKGYHSWIKDLIGLNSYENHGISGYKISDVLARVNSINDTSDVIFVMCGVNDQNFSTPLGEWGDTTTDTIYGSYYVLCNTLRNKYPSKLIIFITPHYQTKFPHKNENVTSYEVGEAMRKTCDLFSIICYDNRVMSEIYPTNLSIYTTDNCHWNDKGHELVGKNIAVWLLSNIGYVNTNTTVVNVSSISATYTQGETKVYIENPLDSLKENLVVVANYDNQTKQTLKSSDYTLSGTLTVGTSTVTVTYLGKTTTFTVNVTNKESIKLENISAEFNPNGVTIYTTDTLDSLKQYLTVTGTYSDGESTTIDSYVLSGTLVEGSSIITVTYSGLSTTFTVNVTYKEPVKSITATFNQGDNTIYTTDALDSLKQYLTVTGTYNDGTTTTFNDYVLSGTLNEGVNTITITYGDKTTTFNVSVVLRKLNMKVTGVRASGEFHICLYALTENVPNVMGKVEYGCRIEPLSDYTPAYGATGGAFTVDTINDLYAGYVQISPSIQEITITDNNDGTYMCQASAELNKIASKAYLCLPVKLINISINTEFNIIEPYIKYADEEQEVCTIGGAFAEETCIVNEITN